MSQTYKIVKERLGIPVIGKDGNLTRDCSRYKQFLRGENGEMLSHEYECMIDLGGNHFAVCNPTSTIDYYSIAPTSCLLNQGEYSIATEVKWGVIRINGDINNHIIPFGETLIFPYVYDRILENNLQTATAYNKDHLTYLDIARGSANYGKQLVPCVLEHASTFDTFYKGVAECSVDNTWGFLPRNCKPLKTIEGSDLLNQAQAYYLSSYLDGDSGHILLGADLKSKYFKLTGIRLQEEYDKVYKKTMNTNNE